MEKSGKEYEEMSNGEIASHTHGITSEIIQEFIETNGEIVEIDVDDIVKTPEPDFGI